MTTAFPGHVPINVAMMLSQATLLHVQIPVGLIWMTDQRNPK